MKDIKRIVNLAFKAVGLAMGVAILVLCGMKMIEVESALTMTGVALTCFGIAMFADDKGNSK